MDWMYFHREMLHPNKRISSNFSKNIQKNDTDNVYLISKHGIDNKVLTFGSDIYLRLMLKISIPEYIEDNCPLFGVYIHDGDFERRHLYHYMMGPYCGQTHHPDSDLTETVFNFTAFTPNLTIVVYSFPSCNDVTVQWTLRILLKPAGSFTAVINPCSAVPHYCTNYWKNIIRRETENYVFFEPW